MLRLKDISINPAHIDSIKIDSKKVRIDLGLEHQAK